MKKNISRKYIIVGLCIFSSILAYYYASQAFSEKLNTVAPGVLSTKEEWVIVADGGEFQNLHHAIDGNKLTCAHSEASYVNNSITLDLGSLCFFNLIFIDHGSEELGFCSQVAVSISQDGTTYRHLKTVYGKRYFTNILLDQPVRARFVRLTAVRQGDKPWAIAEIDIQ